jgi:anti-anti-sigma factor
MDNTLCQCPVQALIAAQRCGAALILTAAIGEIDTHTASLWQQAVQETPRGASERTVVLDLRAVRLIDAAGWAMLIRIQQEMTREGCRLKLLLARGSQPFRAFVTRWLHVALDRIDSLDDLAGPKAA